MPPDSGAVISGVVQVFVDGMATWAAAPQLRLIVASLDPAWLPALVAQLSRLCSTPPPNVPAPTCSASPSSGWRCCASSKRC